MLKLNGVDFTSGRSRFIDSLPGSEEATSKIYVKIMPHDFEHTILDQLDTGSPWSIFEPEVAAAIGILNAQGEQVTLKTRFGDQTGHLERISITVLADDGDSLDVDATVFISGDWPAGNFLGYTGFLERIRTGLDPQENFFYFGPVPSQ